MKCAYSFCIHKILCHKVNKLFHKDKSNERLASLLPQFATHLSDAWDTIFYGEFSSCLSDSANLWGYGFVK